ncbi:uncharacterized protein [Spinacia oleracea]|uniref:DUF4283 domain-containing protein n=1 Tax=Spinacia oleracea TaxID=3562 RepID=A0ABM3R306_SPIOL|nr:uncharacterized protein LOC110779005 [Spinacia oleracea]
MQSIHKSSGHLNSSRANVNVGMISVPILQQCDDVYENLTEHDHANDVRTIESIDYYFENASPVQIDIDDIQEEVDFRNSSTVCYVVGANPPLRVMEGFIRRIWKKYNVDKVVLVKKGIYLVRFFTMDMRDQVIVGHHFFDNEPMIVKPWNVEMDMEKEELKYVPIWIQLRLNFKYWGEKSLFKIVSQIGKPIKRDTATVSRDKLQFARVLVDIHIKQKLPDHVAFVNEHSEMVQVPISYEWRPNICEKCKMKTQPVQKQSVPMETSIPEIDQEGFQRSLRPIKVRPTNPEPTSTTNQFQMLNDDDHSVCSTTEMERDIDTEDDTVKQFLHKYQVGLVGLLEHKVKLPNLGKLYQKVFYGWCFTSNASFHEGGTIIVAWNHGIFSVNIVAVSDQLIHCYVSPVSGLPGFFCSFIYAFNESQKREKLWKDVKDLNTQDAWILCGDLNCVMNVGERIGALVKSMEMVDSCECMQHCQLEDIKSVGNFYTWNNKQSGSARVFSKIERIMSNSKWQGLYTTAEVCFMTEGCFDHSPGLLTVYPRDVKGKKPFKYFTMWKNSPQFISTIQTHWNSQVQGSKMFCVVNRLKKVKMALKELNRTGFTDVQAADLKAYQDMIEAQKEMHLHPDDQNIADLELLVVSDYKVKHQANIDFLKQKAKAAWLNDGDENTSLFHQSIKARAIQN